MYFLDNKKVVEEWISKQKNDVMDICLAKKWV